MKISNEKLTKDVEHRDKEIEDLKKQNKKMHSDLENSKKEIEGLRSDVNELKKLVNQQIEIGKISDKKTSVLMKIHRKVTLTPEEEDIRDRFLNFGDK